MAATRLMSRRHWLAGTCAAGCLLPLPACRPKAAPKSNGSSSGLPPLKKVPSVDYPIGPYLPPLDDGRVRIPAPDPQEWYVSPRSSKLYLCQFTRSRSALVPLPRIRVTVQSAAEVLGDGWETATPDNVTEFAQRVAQVTPKESLIEPVMPMIIGEHACARYVSAAKFRFRTESRAVRSITGHKQVIWVLHRGRLYSFELHINPGTILDYRDAAYAVVAGTQFIDPVEPEEG